MAQKRMFCTDIVESDAFIELSATAQTLYFHLGMRADDDGFVNPQITMRMVGSNKNDLDLLIVKRFVLPFKSGVVVVKHWRINNFIRKDRYKPTNYIDEKAQLNLKENMAYTLDKSQGLPIDEVPWKTDEQIRLTSGQPLVNVGKDRIGKDRIVNIYTHEFEKFWSLYPKKVGKHKSFAEWKKLSKADHDKIFTDIPARAEDDKWVNGFVKDPERYLKHRQFDDEILKPRGAEGQGIIRYKD